jgi:TolA-binding protein
MKFAFPLLLVISGALAVREIYTPMERPFILSPEMVASAVISGGVLAWSMLLENERNECLENFRIQTRSLKDLSLTVRLRFDKAAETLVGGDFGSALTQFQMLVKEYPDNPIMPKALYEIAGILYIMGDIDGAAEAFRTVADRYPLPDLHDRARKGLADCLMEQGDQAGALEQLELFSFNGSGLPREEVALYRESF